MVENNSKSSKKRRRYGSFAWTDNNGKLFARIRVPQQDGTIKTIYRKALNVKHAEQLADEIKEEYELRGQAFLDGRTMKFKTLAE